MLDMPFLVQKASRPPTSASGTDVLSADPASLNARRPGVSPPLAFPMINAAAPSQRASPRIILTDRRRLDPVDDSAEQIEVSCAFPLPRQQVVTAIGAFPWSRLDSTSPHTNTSNFRLGRAIMLDRSIHTHIPPPPLVVVVLLLLLPL